jgi:heme exporter protein C
LPTPAAISPIMHRFANPKAFAELASVAAPMAGAIAAALFAIGLPWALVFAPADYQQGDSARIMFVHVPAAWMCMFIYACMTGCAIAALVWRHLLAEAALRAAAPLGAGFTAIALITGALWGKPMWGAFWVWDARLTSVLVLFFIYLGVMAVFAALEESGKAGRAASILTIVGAVNIPIVKFSVDWWSTLHQPSSVFRPDGPKMAQEFLWPLLIMGTAYMAVFAWLWLLRIRTEILMRRAAILEAAQ